MYATTSDEKNLILLLAEGNEAAFEKLYRLYSERLLGYLIRLIKLEDVHLAQAKNYVVAYDLPNGLLINFGALSLQYKKVFNPKYNPANPIIR